LKHHEILASYTGPGADPMNNARPKDYLGNIIATCDLITRITREASFKEDMSSSRKRWKIVHQLRLIHSKLVGLADYDYLSFKDLEIKWAAIISDIGNAGSPGSDETAMLLYRAATSDIPMLREEAREKLEDLSHCQPDPTFISIFREMKWLIIIAAVLIYLLFVASPMKLNRDMERTASFQVAHKINELNAICKSSNPDLNTQKRISGLTDLKKKPILPLDPKYPCDAFLEGMTIQLGKANTEIQNRLNQEVEWFKLKYLYVGVMLLGFLINTYFKHNEQESSSVVFRFQEAVVSPVTSFILSLTVVVAISIDMQIRSGRIVINQLGTWIHRYAEPVLLGAKNGGLWSEGGMGWEHFLRLEGGYHANTLYAMLFWTNIYYLSISLYVLYLGVTRKALAEGQRKKQHSLVSIIIFGFWILHITILVATLSNHIIPFTFVVTLFPVLTGWFPIPYVHPGWLIIVYITTWLALVFVAKKYVLLKSANRKQ
jgi:hypothetical protein